jgi:hypothetical protein
MTHSYSSLNKFRTCPRQYEYRYVLKRHEPMTEQQQWGVTVHEGLEHKVKSGTPLSPAVAPYTWATEPIEKMRELGAQVFTEHKIAMTREAQPVGFFGATAFLRAVNDVFVLGERTAQNIDYKTGRLKNDFDQLELSSLIAFANYPQVEQIQMRYIWLPLQKSTVRNVNRSDCAKIIDKWAPVVKRVETALASGIFPEQPGGLCQKWCPVTECQHNGRRT